MNGAFGAVDTVIAGFYIGMVFHLAKDLMWDGSQSIRGPWGGTFLKNTYFDDNAYLAANVFFATADLETAYQ